MIPTTDILNTNPNILVSPVLARLAELEATKLYSNPNPTETDEEAEKWLSACIAAGKHAFFTIITLARARVLLRLNPHNRTSSRDKINQYADDMPVWAETGQGIIVANTGELNDGQQRLLACIKAAVPFPTLIVFGVERHSRRFLDIGRKRTISDHLRMAGYQNTKNLATAVGFIYRYENHHTMQRMPGNDITSDEALDLLDEHPEIDSDHKFVAAAADLYKKLKWSLGGYWSLYYLFSRLDSDAADDFFLRLSDGAHDSETDPIWQLREALSAVARETRRKTQHHVVCALFVKAWNHWRNGGQLKFLRWRQDGDSPEKFPVAI